MLSSTARMRGSWRNVHTSWASIRCAVSSSTASGSPARATVAMPALLIGTARPSALPVGK